MFGKLLKHELYSCGRILVPLWAALLFLSGMVFGMSALVEQTDIKVISVFHIIICVLFGLGCFAVFIMAIVVMIKRFYSSVLSDCGYLTNTLPVNAHEIVCSRLITAVFAFILTYAVILLSVYIALSYSGILKIAADEIGFLLKEGILDEPLAIFRSVSPLLITTAALTLLAGCLRCYAAMAIGHSFSNSKKLLSVAFFFVLGMAESLVSSGITGTFVAHNMERFSEDISVIGSMTSQASSLGCIFTTLLVLVYYFVTVFIITNKLNLE